MILDILAVLSLAGIVFGVGWVFGFRQGVNWQPPQRGVSPVGEGERNPPQGGSGIPNLEQQINEAQDRFRKNYD